jgi:plastocyanin
VRRAAMIVVLVAVVALLAAGCAGDAGDEGAAATAATTAPGTAAPETTTDAGGGTSAGAGGRGGYGDRTSGSGSASGDADTDDVRIAGFAFAPRTVSAKVGQKVKWEHQDPGVTHTVTAVDGTFRSRELEEGDEFSHLFQRAGTFAYRCTIHTDMRGTVKVSG